MINVNWEQCPNHALDIKASAVTPDKCMTYRVEHAWFGDAHSKNIFTTVTERPKIIPSLDVSQSQADFDPNLLETTRTLNLANHFLFDVCVMQND